MTRRILPLIVLLLGLATIVATVILSLLPEIRAAYPTGDFMYALARFQRATSAADIALVLITPTERAAHLAAAQFDLFVCLPLYGLFLLSVCAMLAQGVRRLEFWAPALLVGVGLAGDLIETTAQLRILTELDFTGGAIETLRIGVRLKVLGLALACAAFAAIAFFKPRRNWVVFSAGVIGLVLYVLDAAGMVSANTIGLNAVLFTVPLTGFETGATVVFLTLMATAAWRLVRPPAPEDAPTIPVPDRVLRSLAGARWPLAMGAAGAAAALMLHAHRETSVRALPPAAAAISAVAISDDGAFFAVASEDGEIEIWRWRGREPLRLVNPDGPARHMLFDTVTEESGAVRQRLVFSTALGRVRGVDAETGASLLADDLFPRSRTTQLLASNTAELFAAGVDDNGAYLIGLTPDSVRRLELDLEAGSDAPPTMLRRTLNSLSVLLNDGRVIVIPSQTVDPRGRDPAMGDDAGSMQSTDGPAEASSVGVAISDAYPDAFVLVTGGEAVLEEDERRTSLGQCQGEVVESHYVHMIGSGGATATWYFVTSDGFLCIARESNRQWTLQTTQLVASSITAAIYRAGNIVLGLPTGDLRVISGDGRSVGQLGGHRGAVRAIAMTPDGRRAISGAADGTVLTFDVTPSRAPVYARPAAVVAQASENAVTQWASITNIVAPIAGDAPSVADALAGAWARTAAACEDTDSAVLVRIEDGMVISNQGAAWTQSTQVERASERDGALSVRTARGVYALNDARLTIRDAAFNVTTPLTRCGISPAWLAWLRTIPQRAVADSDIEAVAADLRTEPDVVRAVAITERGNSVFDAQDRAWIVFYPDVFSRLTNRRFDSSNPEVSNSESGAAARINRSQDEQWGILRAALQLDPDAALQATAWGPFHRLGSDYASSGYANVSAYVEGVVARAEGLRAFQRWVSANGFADELQAKNWVAFAAGFGWADAQEHARYLARAYAILPIRRDPDAFVESLRGAAGRRVLAAADVAPAAQRLGVDAPALLAVATVATGSGDSFGADGLPITRFDPEAFSTWTGGRYDQSNPQVSQARATGTARNLNHEQRWALVREALTLDPDAALQATLWGTYRISGSEFASLGFDSPLAMVRDAAQSPERQVAQFEARVRALGLVDELQRRDWPTFARVYFGAAATTVSSRELGQLYANLGGRAAAVANVDMSYLDNLVAQSREPLSRADFEAVAADLGVEWQALAAIAEAESGTLGGFAADGRPIILFERHLFSRKTNSRFDETNPNVSNRTAGGYPRTQAERWAQVREAFALDPEAALQSTSYGRYQILGQNFANMSLPDARSYVALLARSERDQLDAFAAFLRANRMVDEVQRRDWAGFARLYNGPAYAQIQMDTRIANAYARMMATPPS